MPQRTNYENDSRNVHPACKWMDAMVAASATFKPNLEYTTKADLFVFTCIHFVHDIVAGRETPSDPAVSESGLSKLALSAFSPNCRVYMMVYAEGLV